MGLKSIDAKMFQKMFLSGARALDEKKEYINELNVFRCRMVTQALI